MNYSVNIKVNQQPIVTTEDFELPERRIHFLFGESGIGKTLIAKSIYGILDPQDWQISVNNQPYVSYIQTDELTTLQRNGYFVFQEPSTHLQPLSTFENQLELNARPYDDFRLNTFRHFFKESEWYNLSFLYPRPNRPSGGEKQRMFLVKAFLRIREWQRRDDSDSALFIFDEPTAHLDNQFRDVFYKMLTDLFRIKPFTALIISHDYSIVIRMQKDYPDLQDKINYHELVKNGQTSELRYFEPGNFIDWHSKLQMNDSVIMDDPVLTVQSGITILERTYGFRQNGRVADALLIPKQSIVYLKAPSGYGKTLFVKALCGLVESANLNMRFLSYDLNDRTSPDVWSKQLWGKRVAMVFQHADETLNPEAPVITHFRGLPLKSPITDRELLEQFNSLFHETLDIRFLTKPVKQLSGGQKQKASLFRALLLRPDLLILDEPFNGLDFISLQNVMRVIDQTISQGTSVLMISHDEELIEQIVMQSNIYYLTRLNAES